MTTKYKWIYRVSKGSDARRDGAPMPATSAASSLLRDRASTFTFGLPLTAVWFAATAATRGDHPRRGWDRLRCVGRWPTISPECRKLDSVEYLSRVESWGKPAQARWFLDSHKWSFFWSERVLTDDGWKPSLHGGLIQHGPRPALGEGGAFTFTTWDYAEKKERSATEDEIEGVCWGIHT